MRPPKTFILMGKTWTISQDDRLDDDDELGNCLGFKCKVMHGKDALAHPGQFRDTIFHECMHAVFYETGLAAELKEHELPGAGSKVDEEMIVRRASTVLLAMLRENPELVDFYMEGL